jgi:hypothetical protein
MSWDNPITPSGNKNSFLNDTEWKIECKASPLRSGREGRYNLRTNFYVPGTNQT